NVAKGQYNEARNKAKRKRQAMPDKHEVFCTLAESMEEKVKAQLRSALAQSKSFEDLPQSDRRNREEVIATICDSLEVICTSASDFINIQEEYFDTAFIHKPEVTGIPRLLSSIQSIISDRIESHQVDLKRSFGTVSRIIEEILEEYADEANAQEARSIHDWRRFCEVIQTEGSKLRGQMQAFHGEISGILKTTIPERIKNVCLLSEKLATQRLESMVKKARELYWSSLNAALKRNGTWKTKDVNFPTGLTRAMVDAVASRWQADIVDTIKATIEQLAKRDASLIERLSETAKKYEPELVEESNVRAKTRAMRQHAAQCIEWTEDNLDRFRESVEEELVEVIIQEITLVCEAAVKDGKNHGKGAKDRILDSFLDGGRQSITAAAKKAEQLLSRHYDALRIRLDEEYLEKHRDPLGPVIAALTNEDIGKVRENNDAMRCEVHDMKTTMTAISKRMTA
ncbi:MAG: hypothetical protein P1V97_13410, partial [Planctomycetota bacterium]|nr:hypothetical protein [Planctomycetota bacterium]